MTFEEKKQIDDKLGIITCDINMNISKEEYERNMRTLANVFDDIVAEGDSVVDDDI